MDLSDEQLGLSVPTADDQMTFEIFPVYHRASCSNGVRDDGAYRTGDGGEHREPRADDEAYGRSPSPGDGRHRDGLPRDHREERGREGERRCGEARVLVALEDIDRHTPDEERQGRDETDTNQGARARAESPRARLREREEAQEAGESKEEQRAPGSCREGGDEHELGEASKRASTPAAGLPPRAHEPLGDRRSGERDPYDVYPWPARVRELEQRARRRGHDQGGYCSAACLRLEPAASLTRRHVPTVVQSPPMANSEIRCAG